MSEATDIFSMMKAHKKALQQKYGIECPECKRNRPKTNATILLPQRRCRVDGYRDQRPVLTDEQWSNA